VELVMGPAEELVDARVDGLVERLVAVEAAPRLAFLRRADCLGVFGMLNRGCDFRDEQRRAEKSSDCNHSCLSVKLHTR